MKKINIKSRAKEVKSEFLRIDWCNKKDCARNTLTVLAFVTVSTLFLYGIDLGIVYISTLL